MDRTFTVLGLSGSLRKASFNTAVLRAAQKLAPAGVHFSIGSLRDIPLYDEDLQTSQGFPPAVLALCDAIRAADAVMIASPEYNYSISGVLKNAIDWVSRAAPPPFVDKPVAILGASPGMIGTARAQYDLRKVFVFLDARVLNKPELMIGGARDKFDEAGELTDATTRELLVKQLVALRDWTLRLHP